ncbi:DUF6191 domain-containing protein [Streptomyces sp. NPDC086783]|uniref:DUF6191 domain-containing protein n=1 Tax=Streptomyces sp. NPDC086783 TaxID=3365758 RepID=UPI0038253733
MFEELFAPGRKHTDDERKRLELTRVDLNDGDPGRGPIDLTSGKVVVRAQPSAPDARPEETAADDPASQDHGAPSASHEPPREGPQDPETSGPPSAHSPGSTAQEPPGAGS